MSSTRGTSKKPTRKLLLFWAIGTGIVAIIIVCVWQRQQADKRQAQKQYEDAIQNLQYDYSQIPVPSGWVIQSTGTDPDGKIGIAPNIYYDYKTPGDISSQEILFTQAIHDSSLYDSASGDFLSVIQAGADTVTITSCRDAIVATFKDKLAHITIGQQTCEAT